MAIGLRGILVPVFALLPERGMGVSERSFSAKRRDVVSVLLFETERGHMISSSALVAGGSSLPPFTPTLLCLPAFGGMEPSALCFSAFIGHTLLVPRYERINKLKNTQGYARGGLASREGPPSVQAPGGVNSRRAETQVAAPQPGLVRR